MKKFKTCSIYLFALCAGFLLTYTSCNEDEKWDPGKTEVIADFEFSIDQENAPVTVLIKDKSQGAYTYFWTLSGGKPEVSIEKQPKVLYEKEGSYEIVLRVCNGKNCKDLTKTVEVKAALPVDVSAAFSYLFIENNDYSPAQVDFTDQSLNPKIWGWKFEGGNPSQSDQKAPGTVSYIAGGKHLVELIVKNGKTESKKTDYVKVFPSELVCKSISEEIWKAPLVYGNMNIGNISIYLDKVRKDKETEENSKSVYQVLILGAAMNIITGGKETEDLLFKVNSSWDWYTKDSRSLDMTVYYRGYKGGFTADIQQLNKSSLKLEETKFDPTFTQLISSVDASGTLLTLLSQPHEFTKVSP